MDNIIANPIMQGVRFMLSLCYLINGMLLWADAIPYAVLYQFSYGFKRASSSQR